MKRDLKNKDVARVFALLVIIGFILIALLNLVSAQTSNVCDLKASIINQDPYPAVPEEYVNLVFQVSGVDNAHCSGARFELVPSYPFSLDGQNSANVLSGDTWMANQKNEWMVAYKVRVDKDALNGISQVEVAYSPGNGDANSYIHEKFNVTIEDSRTNFDAVIQDVSGSDVSIAIANAGENTANSVVVRIPQQQSFMTTVTDGQMVGNLESGDYTIVSFSLSKIAAQRLPGQNNNSRTNFTQQQINQQSNLKFDIYYTDNIGVRRIVNMELPVSMSSNSTMANFFAGNRAVTRTNRSLFSSWYIYGPIIIVIAIAAFVIYRKRKHAKNISKTHSKETPDWISKKESKK